MLIDKHTRHRQIELAREIAPRAKIYLDMCFWIRARDAALGLSQDPLAYELLRLLRGVVSVGAAVCPISASVFMELMKQPYSDDRRLGTARLIDELSCGVSFIDPERLTATEIYRFFLQTQVEPENLYDMQELIWTKLANVLGESHPYHPEFSEEENIRLQKLFFDHMWDCSLTEMVEQFGEAWVEPKDQYPDLSARLTRENRLHAEELSSFEQAYDAELKGGISACGPMTAKVLLELSQRGGERSASHASIGPEEERKAKALLYHAFKKMAAKESVRTVHIQACLHASVRWDKHRKLKPNDFLDFQHAAVAVAYCDAFLTDEPLSVMLNAPKLGMQSVNDCKVLHSLEDAVALLGSLLGPAS